MKMLSRMKFWFQVLAMLFLCFAFGSLGAWESESLSFFATISQFSLFAALAYASFRLSILVNRRRIALRAKRSRYVGAHPVASLAHPAHGRAG